MQLYILGKNCDDKGTQLEQLTVRILECQRFENIQTNIQGAGGNEIDVTAELKTHVGIKTQCMKVLGECKAHNKPIDTTDWLKFIGKVNYEKENNSHTIGIMICLSGANGAVVGLYNERHNSDETIQLIANSDLINLISECFEVETETKVRERLVAMSYGNIYEMNLLYYDRRIYWVTSFMDGKYTISNAKGQPMTREELINVFSLIANYSPYSPDGYIDIREYVKVQEHLTAINMLLLIHLVNGFSGKLEDAAKLIKKDDDTLDTSILGMAINQNPFVLHDKEKGIITLQKEEKFDMVDFYRYILHSGCPLDLIISDFYQNHINKEFIEKIQKVQYGIEIPEEKIEDCLFLIKHSPTALLSAITPNNLFHAYKVVKNQENMRSLYISSFMKMLTDSFVENVKNGTLSNMYHNFFNITGMKVSSNVKIDINGEKRILESYENFGFAKLQGTKQTVMLVMA